MTPSMLRQVWSLVETTQASRLLELDDKHLTHWLLREIREQQTLDHTEAAVLNTYIHSRLPLIRDVAYQRLA